jgi:hypothetical protein
MKSKKHWQCLVISLICFIISGIAFAFQLLAYHDIWYCHKENLAHLYMPVLVVFSFSSVWAIGGVIVGQYHALRGGDAPPHATALGTPVLVLSSTVHLAKGGRQQKKDRRAGEQPAHSRRHEASRQPFCWRYANSYIVALLRQMMGMPLNLSSLQSCRITRKDRFQPKTE